MSRHQIVFPSYTRDMLGIQHLEIWCEVWLA